MSLYFPYKLISLGHAVVPLGGRWVRPRPIFSVSLLGPIGVRAADSLLDSAADDTVFPEEFSADTGIDLSNAPEGFARGLGKGRVRLKYAQATLRITDGREFREWPAWVGFASRLKRPLLGFADFQQFFSIPLLGDREAVELTVTSLYPGT
jgi:hypothetical protein